MLHAWRREVHEFMSSATGGWQGSLNYTLCRMDPCFHGLQNCCISTGDPITGSSLCQNLNRFLAQKVPLMLWLHHYSNKQAERELLRNICSHDDMIYWLLDKCTDVGLLAIDATMSGACQDLKGECAQSSIIWSSLAMMSMPLQIMWKHMFRCPDHFAWRHKNRWSKLNMSLTVSMSIIID